LEAAAFEGGHHACFAVEGDDYIVREIGGDEEDGTVGKVSIYPL
jgi:hypothetical protein